jgi:hypothetical protein
MSPPRKTTSLSSSFSAFQLKERSSSRTIKYTKKFVNKNSKYMYRISGRAVETPEGLINGR